MGTRKLASLLAVCGMALLSLGCSAAFLATIGCGANGPMGEQGLNHNKTDLGNGEQRQLGGDPTIVQGPANAGHDNCQINIFQVGDSAIGALDAHGNAIIPQIMRAVPPLPKTQPPKSAANLAIGQDGAQASNSATLGPPPTSQPAK